MASHSNIDTLYRKYKSSKTTKERNLAFKNLRDEMCKIAYYFAIRHRLIGEQNASKFLINVMEGLPSIIRNYSTDVDFLVFYRKSLELYVKNYIRKDKNERLYNASIMCLQSLETTNNCYNFEFLKDENLNVNPKLKEILESRAVRMFLMEHSVALNDGMLRKLAVNLGADGIGLINKIVEYKKQYNEDKNIKKNRELTSSYFIKKLIGELDDKSKIKDWDGLTPLINSHTHNRVMAQRVPHIEVSKVFDVKKSGVSHRIKEGKKIIENFSNEQKEQRI